MKKSSIIALFGFGLVVFSACSGVTLPAQPNSGEQPATATVTPISDAGEAAPTPTAVVPDGMQPQAPVATPTARPGLEATDPDSVDLASGKPTLLEFFAFW
jgi:hypothetical protein